MLISISMPEIDENSLRKYEQQIKQNVISKIKKRMNMDCFSSRSLLPVAQGYQSSSGF